MCALLEAYFEFQLLHVSIMQQCADVKIHLDFSQAAEIYSC